jgi:hypothetical protein
MRLISVAFCLTLSIFAPGAVGKAQAQRGITCNLKVLSKAELARDKQLVPQLRDALQERKELRDGYAFRFKPALVKDVGEWTHIVAKCCQPLSYEVVLEPQPGGALWVRITGGEGVKEFLSLEMAQLMNQPLAGGTTARDVQ